MIEMKLEIENTFDFYVDNQLIIYYHQEKRTNVHGGL